MASTSVSSIQKRFKYDVFISFRGEDTRKNFVDHLYHALKQKGINTYRDDEEIKKGKRIGDELIRSIDDSKIYIIVFSKNYASSSWCLDELVKIMECQKTNERIAYPVFYDVEPTEVRNQSEAVGAAFTKHVNAEAAGKWINALKEAAGLAGRELKNCFDGHEAKFIQKIVEEISLELRFTNSSVDGKLVGMETRVNDVVSVLEIDVDDVRMIGIKGMGGAGKTTLARAVFNKVSYRFEGSSFVEDVREISKNPLCGLKSLQKQVVSDVLNDPHIIVKDVSDLKKRMCGSKVLVVLDDVDNINQLEALAGELNWFTPGSRFIITTREEQVLVAHGLPKNLILDVNLLSHNEANCLFNKYAFGRVIPNHGYEELACQVVRYAAGLPLTIKVLGSDLRGKDEIVWKDALERLKTIPLKATLEKMEISYDSLEEDHKKIFLDVACILKGWKKERAIIALRSCGFHAINGLKVLELKSLITVSDRGYLGMHDHIEEMGKNIVRRLHPNEPYRHSRLWIKKEIEGILSEDKGIEAATRCLKIKLENPFNAMEGLRNMNKLRFLHVISNIYNRDSAYHYDYYDSDYRYFYTQHYMEISSFLPSDSHYSYSHEQWFMERSSSLPSDSRCSYLPHGLQYLSWDGYPYKCLPENFQANNLVGLELFCSNIEQIWKGGERQAPEKLRFLDLCVCKLKTLEIGLLVNLERLRIKTCWMLVTLDLARAKNLETLKIADCKHLVELHLPVENFNLKLLDLSCLRMRTLNLARAQNLETLKIADCEHLVELHLPVKNFKLKLIDLSYLMMRTLDLSRTQNLDTLIVENCEHLVDQLHMPIELKHLSLRRCGGIWTFDLTQTQSLETLDLTSAHLIELHVIAENLKQKSLTVRSSKMRTLDIGRAQHFDQLNIEGNDDSVELHLPVKKLKYLRLGPCRDMKNLNLTRTRNLEALRIFLCNDLLELHMPLESPELKTIKVKRCDKLTFLNLTGTQNLERLKIDGCDDFMKLYMPLESPELKTIKVKHCNILRALNLTGTRNLERLKIEGCVDFIELQMPVQSPELKTIKVRRCSKLRALKLIGTRNLEKLDLEQCDDFLDLHMPVQSPELQTIEVRRCSKLRALNLTGTRNLEMLHLEQCNDFLELQMPLESPKLKTIKVRRCSKLRALNLIGARNLERLDLEQCDDFLELHMPVESPELKTIEVQCCSKLRALNLTGTRNLERLDLKQCDELLELRMPDDSPKLKIINICCSKLRTIYLGLSPYLECLDLHDCFNLVEIQAPLGYLCGRVRFEPFVVNQVFPMVGFSAELHLKARSLGKCPLHPDNNLPKFHFEYNYKELLPLSTRNLEKLISLGLCACTNFASLSGTIIGIQRLRKLTLEGSIPEVPKEIEQLECLEELILLSINIEHLPDSICTLKHLKVLQLKSCSSLTQLPEYLGRLKCLEELCLINCTSLRDIPNSISELKCLKCFHLTNGLLVESLPKEMVHLQTLKEVYIQGTGIIDPPDWIFQLKGSIFYP